MVGAAATRCIRLAGGPSRRAGRRPRRLLPEEHGWLPARRAKQPQAPRRRSPKKPGMFAPKGEKELYKAVKAQDPKAIEAGGRLAPGLPPALLQPRRPDDADERSRLKQSGCWATRSRPARTQPRTSSSPLTSSRASSSRSPSGVTAELPVNRDAVGLALAELKQDHGDLAGAIDVVEQLEPTTYSAVSLAELYAQTGRWDDVIELTEGMKNEDDASALLCVFRGQAFREQGFHDAAHEALKEALRSRSRAAPIRHLALAERAQNYLAQGKKAMARKDLERILAEDSDYEGVREQLAELA